MKVANMALFFDLDSKYGAKFRPKSQIWRQNLSFSASLLKSLKDFKAARRLTAWPPSPARS